ncbi:hypothetical protein [Pseudactinotalea sp. HY158]|uniref:hypothetical protein n=1 Tax=Pseudactinotalea sp. HY158 TaxID=2654547 RepID=UPI00129C733C|nr:hypothetical protein [Pseudactinotalea sp. HY158]QGH70355.1 hypothetical protein GCE65_13290 [Pseudactinotalea sp. HY158]
MTSSPNATVPTNDGPNDAAGSPTAAKRRTPRAGIRSTTVVWGLLLIAGGVLVAALGLGYRLDAITFTVIVSAGLGVALLLLAILPRRAPRATVTVYEPWPTEGPGVMPAAGSGGFVAPAATGGVSGMDDAPDPLDSAPAAPAAAPTEPPTTAAQPDQSTIEFPRSGHEPPPDDATATSAGHPTGDDWWDPSAKRD